MTTLDDVKVSIVDYLKKDVMMGSCVFYDDIGKFVGSMLSIDVYHTKGKWNLFEIAMKELERNGEVFVLRESKGR